MAQFKWPLLICLVGLVLIIGGLISSGNLNKPKTQVKGSSYVPKLVKIDLKGAVVHPGVYAVGLDSRVEDVIKLSGGFLASASASFVTKSLNLSAKVVDGEKIYIPFEGEIGAGSSSGLTNSNRIGLNSASQKELEDLPSVGPATALKIIAGRPFQEPSELISKKILSRSSYGKLKDLVDLH